MSIEPGLRRPTLLLVGLALISLLIAAPTHAQTSTVAPTEGPTIVSATQTSVGPSTPTPPVAPPPVSTTPPVAPPPVSTTENLDLRVVSVLLLWIMACGAIYGVFRYIESIQNKYYDVTKYLIGQGQAPHAVVISATESTARGVAAARGLQAQPAEPSTPLRVKGPSTLTFNVESTDYQATRKSDDNKDQPVEGATWTVSPEGAAIVNPLQGAKVRVTPKQLGAFDLIASESTQDCHFPIGVIAPTTVSPDLPFIGQGWGTIILAIIFGTAVAVLGLTGVLGPEVVGTLFGALLGYIFGFVSSSSSAAGRRSGSTSRSQDAGNGQTGV